MLAILFGLMVMDDDSDDNSEYMEPETTNINDKTFHVIKSEPMSNNMIVFAILIVLAILIVAVIYFLRFFIQKSEIEQKSDSD